MAACNKDCGCSELSNIMPFNKFWFVSIDDLFRNIGEFEVIAGKEEDVFIGKIKSGLLQTCNTFLEVTFPSLNVIFIWPSTFVQSFYYAYWLV